ncbi:hypothetical protein DYBT9623_00803 [Dyadobacter sp. CECT 9623]|uniref:Uncharacterized protein n=1 Tax=Dyadobacter linearis TaxID=2823330 RepID=A0ABN7R6S0_9BACT|nr:hypothetical protein [Dyadobacter sp. CECT 9623]CAG5068075.1 hypothetical protein DYBT9623_00803 [Dyadobacter sp. CECT 9623]
MSNALKTMQFAFFLFTAASAGAQQLNLTFKDKTQIIKRGDFIQCISSRVDRNSQYYFGKVEVIGTDGISIKKNPFLAGSGGFLRYEDITSIAKVRIVKRSILPAIIGGSILGQLASIRYIPSSFGPLIGMPAAYALLVLAIKYNRKELRRNQVNKTVFLTPSRKPSDNESYFEYQ